MKKTNYIFIGLIIIALLLDTLSAIPESIALGVIAISVAGLLLTKVFSKNDKSNYIIKLVIIAVSIVLVIATILSFF